MGVIERRFKALIKWAESKGPDGQVAAYLLRVTWRDLEGNLDQDMLDMEDMLDTEELGLLESAEAATEKEA